MCRRVSLVRRAIASARRATLPRTRARGRERGRPQSRQTMEAGKLSSKPFILHLFVQQESNCNSECDSDRAIDHRDSWIAA